MQTSTRAGAPSRPRWRTVAWTAVLCAGCIALIVVIGEWQAQTLATPETAMYGAAIVEASLACTCAFLAAVVILGILAAKHLLTAKARVLAILPAVSIGLGYGAFHSAVDRINAASVLHDNFDASEASLDALADAIEVGEEMSFPVRAGKFEVIGGEKLRDGAVVLYTKAASFGFNDRWGFVRDEKQFVNAGSATIVGIGGEAGSYHAVMRLRGPWFVLFHHYLFVKRGWS